MNIQELKKLYYTTTDLDEKAKILVSMKSNTVDTVVENIENDVEIEAEETKEEIETEEKKPKKRVVRKTTKTK